MPIAVYRCGITSSGIDFDSAMSETPKDKDQEKGDEVLRRLLKTPPDPKTGKGDRNKRDQRSVDGESTDRCRE
jgi:hypothetical protein